MSLLYLIAIIVLLVIVVPLSFSVIGGFRSNAQLAADPVGLPDPWVWTNYQTALTDPSFYGWIRNSVLIALDHNCSGPSGRVAGCVRDRSLPVPGPGMRLRPVHSRPPLPRRGGDPSPVHHSPADRAAEQPSRNRHAPGGIRAPTIDRDPSPVLPQHPQRPRRRSRDRRLRAAALLLVGHAPAVTARTEHDRGAHRRRQLECLPASAAGVDPAWAVDAAARHQQHLGSVRDGHRDDPGLHHTGHDPGTRLLLHCSDVRSSPGSPSGGVKG